LGLIKQIRAGVVFVDEIPRISVGKIDRKYFKQLVKDEVIRDNE
jgi:acyl-coenzyme A synthetase/AMP-(fatty) acid ligase